MPSCRGAVMPSVVFLAALTSACELTEVTIAPGQRVVVVQSVISRSQGTQFVVVEYSQAGESITNHFGYPRIPPGAPRIPISGARVTIRHQGTTCAGRVDTLPELPPTDSLVQTTGTYLGLMCRPEPGERLLLRVETPAGEVVTGATTVPGASARTLTAGTFDAPSQFWVFHRQRDTLGITVTPVSGKGLQIEMRTAQNPDDPALFAFTDTMAIRFPGTLVNPFEGDDGASIFRPGRYYVLAVALTDTNYYDFLRSRSDPFTGRGFINHLTGGIGVFGSVETDLEWLRVVAPVDDPREGTYRLTGVLDTANVDVTLELYLDDVQPTWFSAFVRGSWWEGPIDLSTDGVFPAHEPGRMTFNFVGPFRDSLPPARYYLEGVRPAARVPFPVIVRTFFPPNRDVVDTLTAQQISGPGPTASPRR